MWCIHCGAQLPSDVRFCPTCGKPQPAAAAPPADDAAPQQPAPQQAPWGPPPPGIPAPAPAPRSRRGVWIAVAAVVALLLAGVGALVLTGQGPWQDEDTVPAAAGKTTEAPATEEPAGQEQDEPTWSAADLTVLLQAVADDEAEEWSAFSADSSFPVPCGGEAAHGVAPDLVERTAGGSDFYAGAQIFADAGGAERELARLQQLIEDCGPHDYLSYPDGSVLDSCSAPENIRSTPVLRYEQRCEKIAQGAPFSEFLLRSGNAVIGFEVSDRRVPEFEGLLAGLLVELRDGPGESGPAAGGPGPSAGGVTSDDFINDWSGRATGALSGQLSMQVGQYDPDAGPTRPLTGDISFRDLGCYGYWDEVARDSTSVTVRGDIDTDPQDRCDDEVTMVLTLEGGRLLVDGGEWTAALDPQY